MVSFEQTTVGGATVVTVIVLIPASLAHLPFLQMAEYVVVVDGVTVIVAPVAPVDQTMIPPSQPAAESVTL